MNHQGTKDTKAEAVLDAETVRRLERVLGGDPVTEALILAFIAERYGAETLLDLPAKVAAAILQRPADFIRAAKEHRELEVGF
jgi:hypothetical protein